MSVSSYSLIDSLCVIGHRGGVICVCIVEVYLSNGHWYCGAWMRTKYLMCSLIWYYDCEKVVHSCGWGTLFPISDGDTVKYAARCTCGVRRMWNWHVEIFMCVVHHVVCVRNYARDREYPHCEMKICHYVSLGDDNLRVYPSSWWACLWVTDVFTTWGGIGVYILGAWT